MNINDLEINCCGCGACYNMCVVDAIEMKMNEEGFLNPVVNVEKCVQCGKCEAVCPVLHTKYENNSEPSCYAVMANYEVRNKSSSGGVFGILAETTIKQEGVVFGAAWKDDFSVYHCEATTLDEIPKFHESKYLQSNTEKTFAQVKGFLKENRKVLYSGTPCQIAGLYGYLGEEKRSENLITVEVLCHGVPSQKVFDKYLKENFEVEKIQKISFSEKNEFKWGKGLSVLFDDGNKCVARGTEDVYYEGFLKNLYLNTSCNNCQFNMIPRQADITVGDFWGIENYDVGLNDGYGTSLVLLNNEHAKEFFSSCEADFKRLESVPLDFVRTTVNKNVWQGFKENSERERFFEQLDTKSVKENVRQCLEKTFDVGLVGIYSVKNFGGAVTYYALYSLLKEMGYSVLMIDRPKTNSKVDLEQIYYANPYKQYEMAPNYLNADQMRELSDVCETFVVGSDQLFNTYIYNLFGKFASLNWVCENRKKIAIAVSFGREYYFGDEKERAQLAYELKRFDAISVREESGANIFKEKFGIDATWILDPIFLCNKKDIEDLIQEKRSEEAFIGGYILDKTSDKLKILEDVITEYNLPYHIFGERFEESEAAIPQGWEKIEFEIGKIEDRLKMIRDCKVFITDSFHGMCLAILFRKPFISIVNEGRGKARFLSLQKLLGVELVNDYADYINKKDVLKNIDYDLIHQKIGENRERSISWIKNALSVNIPKEYSEKNILENHLRVYGNIWQLGLKTGCRVQEIIDALPVNSYFQQAQGKKGEPIEDTPVEYGVLTIKKTTSYFVEVQFVQSTLSNSKTKLFVANVRNKKIEGWTSYAKEEELIRMRERVDDLEKDVKFLIRKYANSLND